MGANVLRELIQTSGFIYFSIFHRLEFIGMENIPKQGAAILYANHISNADPVIATCRIKRMIYFMAKEELFKGKLLTRFWTNIGAFPVKRGTGDISAIKKSIECLKAGYILGMFPEGTRRRKDKHPEPKPGLALLAIRSKSPVMPVVITDRPKCFNKIKVIYGKPFELTEYYDKKLSMNEYAEISKKLMDEVEKLKQLKNEN
ncbi:MAG: lysophospholipid acyltransferase family protein [Ignavibacteriales bacterium]